MSTSVLSGLDARLLWARSRIAVSNLDAGHLRSQAILQAYMDGLDGRRLTKLHFQVPELTRAWMEGNADRTGFLLGLLDEGECGGVRESLAA